MRPWKTLHELSLILALQSLAAASPTRRSDATCPQGTYVDPSGRCSWCREGTYQDEVGAKQCKECRPGTVSREIAAVSPVVCKNCAPGTYATSTTACAECPLNTISPAGAVDAKECSALAGYYGQPGTAAAGCPANYYCVSGTFVPTPCPDGTTSPPLASSCAPGVGIVVLYDWIFTLLWIALVMSGVVWLGAYKMVKDCYHHVQRPLSASYPKTIHIRIVRAAGGDGTTK